MNRKDNLTVKQWATFEENFTDKLLQQNYKQNAKFQDTFETHERSFISAFLHLYDCAFNIRRVF